MTKNKKRKEILFDIYSKNLLWVKKHPSISFEPDFEEGYICPLCFELFSRQALEEKCKNPLTFDHNPPKSLKGKNGILTCKNCNSKAGHKIDNHLLTRLEEIDFICFKPKSNKRVILNNNENKVTADFEFNDDGGIRINIDSKNSNPKHVDNFLAIGTSSYKAYDPFLKGHNILEAGNNWELKFDMKWPNKSNERLAEIALLKIAYLYAFQRFGYGFLINSSLFKVREQILNPDKNILPKVLWINYNFPEELIGLNIINKPKELFCFLIIFNIETKSQIKQYAIALPGTSEPHLNIYTNIERLLCKDEQGGVNINIVHIEDKEFVKDEKFAFASYQYWKKLVSSQ